MVERVPFAEAEYQRRLAHAEHTLAAARADLEAKFFSWGCFKAQQAAEYALKGLLRGAGAPAIGHSVLQLLMDLAEGGSIVPETLRDCARVLDRFYIPTRYADAIRAGEPVPVLCARRHNPGCRLWPADRGLRHAGEGQACISCWRPDAASSRRG